MCGWAEACKKAVSRRVEDRERKVSGRIGAGEYVWVGRSMERRR